MIDFSEKVLVFTDIHFGLHSNSQSYIDICSDTMKWIKEYSIENGIKNILFMGDYFDSRASIDVKTLNAATETLYSISDDGIEIALILGNHDIYLRDSTSIHSLFAFNGHNGITVVDKPMYVDGVMLLPWQYGVSSDLNMEIGEDLKYVFCHHNFPVDFFFGNKVSKTKKKRNSDTFVDVNRYETEFGFKKGLVESVIRNSGFIFSGHIHNRVEIPVGNDGKSKVVIVGSPFETSWGFGDVECGAYVVDFSNGSYEFISNPYNKKHKEIRTSNYEDDFNSIDFSNSIVRLTVDTQESFDTISKIQSRIQQSRPFSVENTKYEFSVAEFIGNRDEVSKEMCDDGSTTIATSKLDYIKKAIDSSDLSQFTFISNGETKCVDKSRLKDIATFLFEKGK